MAQGIRIGLRLGTTSGTAAVLDDTSLRCHRMDWQDFPAGRVERLSCGAELALLNWWITEHEPELQQGVHDSDTPVAIAVRADATEDDRLALDTAAREIGFDVSDYVEEPIAAVAAYEWERGSASEGIAYRLVVAIGASACEASLVRTYRGERHCIAHRRDESTGGDAYDVAIVRWIVDRVRADHGIQLPADCRTLRRRAESAKRALSGQNEVSIDLAGVGTDVAASVMLSRAEFEASVDELLQRMLQQIDEVLEKAGLDLSKSRLEFILAGGGSKMPCVGRVLRERYPDRKVGELCFPEDAVAYGAILVSLKGDLPPSPAREGEARSSDAVAGTRLSLTTNSDAEEAAAPPPNVLEDDVEFTVFRPKVVRPGEWHDLLAFAHLSDSPPDADPEDPTPAEQVQQIARQLLGDEAIDDYKQSGEESKLAVPREGELTFVPYLPGFDCNPKQHSFLWLEPVHSERFRIRARPETDGTTATGHLKVFLGNVEIAEITLKIKVDGTLSTGKREARESSQSRPFKKIFASYSHDDLAIVKEFERFASAIGDEYLRDWQTLRAGEVWNDRLMEMIREADIFQLFWSTNAMKSKFVRQEWEYALSLGKPNFVRPCYWERPMPSSSELPTETLRRLHFHCLDAEFDRRTESVAEPPRAAAPGAPLGVDLEAQARYEREEQERYDAFFREKSTHAVDAIVVANEGTLRASDAVFDVANLQFEPAPPADVDSYEADADDASADDADSDLTLNLDEPDRLSDDFAGVEVSDDCDSSASVISDDFSLDLPEHETSLDSDIVDSEYSDDDAQIDLVDDEELDEEHEGVSLEDGADFDDASSEEVDIADEEDSYDECSSPTAATRPMPKGWSSVDGEDDKTVAMRRSPPPPILPFVGGAALAATIVSGGAAWMLGAFDSPLLGCAIVAAAALASAALAWGILARTSRRRR